MHPVVGLFLIWIVIATLASSRNSALVCAVLTLNFVTPAQRLYLLGMNLPAMRIFIFAAIARILIRREYSSIRLCNLDWIVVLYGISTVSAYTLQQPSLGSLNYAIGNALDAIGAYFIIRVLIRGGDGFGHLVRALGWVSLVILVLFLFESRTGVNPMSYFGGVPANSDIRGGRIRIAGTYPHSILAGAYWAAALPLFLGFRFRDGHRMTVMYAAAISSLVIVFLSASSTPLASAALGVAAAALYYQRSSLTAIKLGLLAGLFALALVMHHPIWFLLSKVDLVGGSTGYYRYLLVDNFIRHWHEWYQVGIPDTVQWGAGLGLGSVGLRDLANQFVYEGTRGGAASLALFIAAIVVALRYVGTLVRAQATEDERRQSWHLGISVVVHVTSFVAVSYYGQVKFAWWMTLAICASLYQQFTVERTRTFVGVAVGEGA